MTKEIHIQVIGEPQHHEHVLMVTDDDHMMMRDTIILSESITMIPLPVQVSIDGQVIGWLNSYNADGTGLELRVPPNAISLVLDLGQTVQAARKERAGTELLYIELSR